MKHTSVFKLTCLLVLVSGISAFAGNLEPNAPPGSTMKSLDQVEPRTPITSVPITISQSGSYYLTKNLTAAGTAITVDANNVTIDLCGFTLAGPDSGTNYGIYMNGRKNVEIRNGTIRDFGDSGIYEYSSSGQNHRIIDIRSISNGYDGINLSGGGHIVKECTTSDNGTSVSPAYGIYARGDSCLITSNVVYNNGTSATAGNSVYGIYTQGYGCMITGNSVYNNGRSSASNVFGIMVFYPGCTITGNTVYGNGYYAGAIVSGIDSEFAPGSAITGNTVYYNGYGATGSFVYGIYAGAGGTVAGNSASFNGLSASGTRYGIYLGGYNLVDQNTSYNNGTNMNAPATCVFGKNCAP